MTRQGVTVKEPLGATQMVLLHSATVPNSLALPPCAGEAVIFNEDNHRTSVHVTSQELHVLRLDRRDMRKLLHPADADVRPCFFAQPQCTQFNPRMCM
jgi:hypothetical protein